MTTLPNAQRTLTPEQRQRALRHYSTEAAVALRIEQLEAALLAWKAADDAADAHAELVERSVCEGWDNDPTGAGHVLSAGQHAWRLRAEAVQLRDAALAGASHV